MMSVMVVVRMMMVVVMVVVVMRVMMVVMKVSRVQRQGKAKTQGEYPCQENFNQQVKLFKCLINNRQTRTSMMEM